jgi:hypothetical protein
MYRMPSEFIRQKNTIVGPVTAAHGVGAFAGYLLAYLLGGSALLTVACVALGLVLTTVKVQGLVLYQFLPIAVAFLARKLTDDTLEPEEGPAEAPQLSFAMFDGEGRPIIFREEV